jgi:hypothetical protein
VNIGSFPRTEFILPGSMAQNTIVLFHFHSHFDLCRARIALLRRLNADVRVFGLFGGDPASMTDARALEACGIEHVYADSRNSPAWNKKNTDLAVAGWYRHTGRSVEFDRVHVVQWDMLFFAPLSSTYPSMPDEAIGLTGLIPLAEIQSRWFWTTHALVRDESQRLLDSARQRFAYRNEPFACIGPGYSLSRAFLDGYAALGADDVGHDEMRLPLFAQILGFELVDTGFYGRWMDPVVESVFNADAKEIEPAVVEAELAREHGRRVFHPCRERFDGTTIDRLLEATCYHQ